MKLLHVLGCFYSPKQCSCHFEWKSPQHIFVAWFPGFTSALFLLKCHHAVLFPQADSSDESFLLRAEDLEARVEALHQEGRRVRAFMLVHPNNPLGDVYSPQLLSDLMDVCARYAIWISRLLCSLTLSVFPLSHLVFFTDTRSTSSATKSTPFPFSLTKTSRPLARPSAVSSAFLTRIQIALTSCGDWVRWV